MKLIETRDWKAVHFKDRTILRTDRNLYPELTWWELISIIEVQPTDDKGHYIAIQQEGNLNVKNNSKKCCRKT